MKNRLFMVICLSTLVGCTDGESSPDGSVVDAGPAPDASAHDAAPPGPDARVEDAGTDAFVPPDAPPALPTYDVTELDEVVARAVDVLVCDAQADLECGYGARCDCSGGTAPADRDACLSAALDACRTVQREYFEGALAGAVLSSELADECLARQRELRASCESADVTAIDACTRVTSAANELGSSCTPGDYPQLCGDGLGECLFTSSCIALGVEGWDCAVANCATGLVCRGTTCAPPGAAGDSCEDLDDCVSPLVCVAGTCGTRAAVGAACAEDDECAFGARCDESVCVAGVRACGEEEGSSCGSGHACTSSYIGSCQPRGAAGASCEANGDCVDGLLCLAGTCASVLRGDGEPCYDATAGVLPCGAGFYCDTDVTLSCQPRLAPGAACVTSSVCSEGNACVSSVCAAPPGAGEACGADYDCASGLLCDASFTCSPPSGVGGECSVAMCAPELVCRGSFTCEERLGDGGECFADADCIATHRCDGFPGVCVPREADGAPCSASECGPSSFCDFETVIECVARAEHCG